ncbi:MAG: phage tail tape measure protein [Pseudomonadota bacterium]
MNERLKLEVLLAAIDKVTGPFKTIAKGSGETAKALKAARGELDALQAQGRQIDSFRKVSKDAAIAANMLKAAQDRVRGVKEEIAKVPVPTRDMARALKEAQQEAAGLKMRHNDLIARQQKLRSTLAGAGIDTKKLSEHSRELTRRQEEAAKAVAKHDAALKAQNKTLARMHAAKADYARSLAGAQRVRDMGMAAAGAGAAIGLPVAKATKDYATFEDAMLGVAKQVEGARDANGKLTATYYEMGRAIKEMSERIPMATTDIAAIVEAGAKMGIQGKQNLLIYAETTAVMAEAFELPVEQIGEQIGKISRLYKIPIQDVKALGDAINWLDDNAESNGGDIIEVMQRVAGAATMVGMSYKEAAALGSTFLTLGAKAEVAASATNAMIRELSVATLQGKRFQGGLEMLKLDDKALQFDMSKDATGTIIKVLEAIKQLPQEKQLEAATRLFGKEFGDDAAKLAQNIGEYRRQLELVNAERAKGSMEREAQARKESINARLQIAKNAMFNISSDLGEHLKPALAESLEKTLAIVQAIRAWAAENPGFAGGLMTAVKWLALGVTTIGALLLAVGGILVPIAAFKFGLAAVGISGSAAAAGMWAFLKPVLLVAGAAYAGWQAGKLLGAGIDGLLSKALGYQTTLGGALYDLVQFVSALPGKFVTAGGQMIDGLIAGIQQRWQALKEAVTGIAASTVGWLKDKLGIRSPSRVFAELGGFTMAGFEQGILHGQGGPLAALAKAAKGFAAAGAGVALSGAAMAMPTLDTRPPLGLGGGMMAGGPMIVQITINPSPGMDEQALARAVAAELQRVEAQRAARGRSRLADRD